MLEIIRKSATEYPPHEMVREEGEAYVFGPLFDLDEYDHVGYLEITEGEVGFMEENLTRKKYRKKKGCTYKETCGPLRPNDMTYIKEVHEKFPEIIWLGGMNERKAVCHLHFHVDEVRDRIDSIIIDRNYFYIAHTERSHESFPSSISFEKDTPYGSEEISIDDKHLDDQKEKHLDDQKEKHLDDQKDKHVDDQKDKHVDDQKDKHDKHEKHVDDQKEKRLDYQKEKHDKHVDDQKDKHDKHTDNQKDKHLKPEKSSEKPKKSYRCDHKEHRDRYENRMKSPRRREKSNRK